MADILIESFDQDPASNGATHTLTTDVGSLSSAFVRPLSGSRQGGGGPTGSTGDEGPDNNVAAQLTATDTVTFYKGNSDATKLTGEVWRYTGGAGGANEFIVRGRYAITIAAASTSASQAVSGISNEDKCVPFLQGVVSSNASNSAHNEACVAVHMDGAGNVVASRNTTGSVDITVYVVVVEFTGSNWSVGHAVSSSHDASNETVTLNTDSDGVSGSTFDTTDWETAFIEASMEGDSVEQGLADCLALIYPAAGTTQVVVSVTDADGNARNDGDVWVHVVQNDDLIVKRSGEVAVTEGNGSYGTDLGFPTGTSTSRNLNELALEWYVSTSGTGTAHMRGNLTARITDATGTIRHWVHRSGNNVISRYAVIDLSQLDAPTGTAANDERSAETSGIATTSDERSAEVHGQLSDSSERSAEVDGQPQPDAAVRQTYSANDCAGEFTGDDGSVNITATQYLFSTGISSDYEDIGIRFVDVDVPQGATIRRAFLEVYMSGATTNGSKPLNLKGEDADNAAAFTTATNDVSGRTKTTASSEVEGEIEDDTRNYYHQIEVTAIVQEIINRTGWSRENAMAFIFTASGSDICTMQMDGAANPPRLTIIQDADTTGILSPTANAAGGGGGFTNPANAYASNNSYATYPGNDAAYSHVYYNFNIPSLTGATIDDIIVRVEGKAGSTNDDHKYAYELSWDGGSTWTTLRYASHQWMTADQTIDQGGGYDGYSHTFVPSDLTNANFRVRISSPDDTDNNDIDIDYVGIEVLSHTTGTNDNDTRSAETTGTADATDERSAETAGELDDTDERAAETSGEASENSSRAAETTGVAQSTDERAAEATGANSANDTRAAEADGVDTALDTRSAETEGVDTASDTRSAETDGTATASDTVAAEATGVDTASDERAAETEGVDGANDTRAAETDGIATDNDERASETHGQLSDSDTRAAETDGAQGANETRSAEVSGIDTDNDSRAAEVDGIAGANDERAAETFGTLGGGSDRDAEVHGVDTANEERSAEATGSIDVTDEVAAETTGEAPADDERAAEIHGKQTFAEDRSAELTGSIDENSSRNAEVSGISPANDERSAVTTGILGADDERSAEATGTLGSSDERSAEVEGVELTVSTRSAEVRGSGVNPYCPATSPLTNKTSPFTNKTSPFSGKTNPLTAGDNPLTSYPKRDC